MIELTNEQRRILAKLAFAYVNSATDAGPQPQRDIAAEIYAIKELLPIGWDAAQAVEALKTALADAHDDRMVAAGRNAFSSLRMKLQHLAEHTDD